MFLIFWYSSEALCSLCCKGNASLTCSKMVCVIPGRNVWTCISSKILYAVSGFLQIWLWVYNLYKFGVLVACMFSPIASLCWLVDWDLCRLVEVGPSSSRDITYELLKSLDSDLCFSLTGELVGMAHWWTRPRPICCALWLWDRGLLEWRSSREAGPCVPSLSKSSCFQLIF